MLMAGVLAWSNKRIIYFEWDYTYNVFDEIDESYQSYRTDAQLSPETMILVAIESVALFYGKHSSALSQSSKIVLTIQRC